MFLLSLTFPEPCEFSGWDSIPPMVEWAWKPQVRHDLAMACPAGHVALMVLCSQKFLQEARTGRAGAIESFFHHLHGVQEVLSYPARARASYLQQLEVIPDFLRDSFGSFYRNKLFIEKILCSIMFHNVPNIMFHKTSI